MFRGTYSALAGSKRTPRGIWVPRTARSFLTLFNIVECLLYFYHYAVSKRFLSRTTIAITKAFYLCLSFLLFLLFNRHFIFVRRIISLVFIFLPQFFLRCVTLFSLLEVVVMQI